MGQISFQFNFQFRCLLIDTYFALKCSKISTCHKFLNSRNAHLSEAHTRPLIDSITMCVDRRVSWSSSYSAIMFPPALFVLPFVATMQTWHHPASHFSTTIRSEHVHQVFWRSPFCLFPAGDHQGRTPAQAGDQVHQGTIPQPAAELWAVRPQDGHATQGCARRCRARVQLDDAQGSVGGARASAGAAERKEAAAPGTPLRTRNQHQQQKQRAVCSQPETRISGRRGGQGEHRGGTSTVPQGAKQTSGQCTSTECEQISQTQQTCLRQQQQTVDPDQRGDEEPQGQRVGDVLVARHQRRRGRVRDAQAAEHRALRQLHEHFAGRAVPVDQLSMW